MRKLLLIAIIFCGLGLNAWAAGCAGTGACYYVAAAGTNNWSDTTKWYTTSGGVAGTNGSVPTSADNADTDALSYATAWTLTVDATANCKDLNLGNPATGVLTLAGNGGDIQFYGSVVLSSGVIATFNKAFIFKAISGTKTFTTNAVILNSGLSVQGAGGTLQLADNYSSSFNAAGYEALYYSAGTFDPNGKTVTLTGNAILLNFTPSLFNLTVTPTTPAKTDYLKLYSNITGTGTLTVSDGATATNRVIIQSSAKGTQRTVNFAAVSIANADFQDIAGAGAANWDLSAATGGSGDCGGNTGITFTTPRTAYYYRASTAATFDHANAWFNGTGGTGGLIAPNVVLPQDTLRFDANSIGAAGFNISQNMPRIGAMNWTGVTNDPTYAGSTTASFFGSMTLVAPGIMEMSGATNAYTYEGRGASTMTRAGQSSTKNWIVNAPLGSLTLSDAFVTTGTITVSAGTLNDGGNAVTASSITGTAGDSIVLTGTTALTGTGTVLTFAGTDSSSGDVRVTNTSATAKTIAGGGKNLGILTLSGGAGGGSYVITGANTFNQLKDDGTATHSITFPNSTTTIADWQVRGTAGAVITVQRTGASGTANVSKSTAGPLIGIDYLIVSNVTATQPNIWYAGVHSTGVGTTTNWLLGPLGIATGNRGLLGVGR